MRLSQVSLLFAATASAIDIRMYANIACDVAYVACTNINPNVCCYTDVRAAFSVGFHAIPGNWQIGMAAYTGPIGCENMYKERVWNRGSNNDWCISDRYDVDYYGGTYIFGSSKRSVDTDGGNSTCTIQKPDILGLADGQEYNISELDDVQLATLIDHAFNGTTTEGIPHIYKRFAVAK